MSSSTAPQLERLRFLDALRLGALGLLMLYHVGMYYVTWPWHIKSPWVSTALEPWMNLINPWRMSLLFLISGAVTTLLVRSDTPWLRARMRRLGLPLLVGVLLIVPPQSYWQVQQQMGYAGDYLDFMRLYLSGSKAFCQAASDCLILPTWNHLWFLPYLMAYTLCLWVSLRVAPGWPDRCGAWLAQRLSAWSLLVLPWLILSLGRAALRPWFDVTHALVNDPLAHVQYAPAFLIGALWARTPGVWSALAQLRHAALLIVLVTWGLRLMSLGLPAPLLSSLYAAQQWAGVVAAIGYAWVHCAQSNKWLSWLVERIFAVYVLHQTLIMALAVALRPLALTPIAEGLVLVAGTVGAALLIAAVCERLPPTRVWLGLPR